MRKIVSKQRPPVAAASPGHASSARHEFGSGEMPSIHSALQRCGGGRSAYPLRNRPGILFGAICTDSAEPGLGGGNTRRLGSIRR